jgi:hypothetical protein
MTKIQQYHFGYVLENVNATYEILSEQHTERLTVNIFGNPIIVNDYVRVAWCRFIPSYAISQAYNTYKECKEFQNKYEETI